MNGQILAKGFGKELPLGRASFQTIDAYFTYFEKPDFFSWWNAFSEVVLHWS